MANTSMEDPNPMQQRFRGCLLGLALGDALGVPFEGAGFIPPERVLAAAENEPVLRYTDDTHMTIGAAESLIARRGFDGRDMAEKFIDNFEQEPWRGYGPGPPRIFERIKAGAPWDRAAEDIYPGGSFGNGSAMRVAPIGIFFYRDLEKVIYSARLQSLITHTHPLGVEGAILQALAVALAVSGPKLSAPAILKQLTPYASEEPYRQKLVHFEALLKITDPREITARLGNGVEAINSVPTAICCFLRHPDSYEEAVVEAVSLGGDADTIACMAGAISGARLGIKALPEKWLAKLENRSYLDKLARDLYQAAH